MHSFFHFTRLVFNVKSVTQDCSGPGQSEGQTAADQPLSSCWWGNRGRLEPLVVNKQWRYSALWWSVATNTLLKNPAGLRKQQRVSTNNPYMARKHGLICSSIWAQLCCLNLNTRKISRGLIILTLHYESKNDLENKPNLLRLILDLFILLVAL